MAGQRGAMSTYHLSGPKFHSPLSPGYPAVQGTPVPEALGIVRVPRTDKAVLSIKETDLPGLRGQECPLWICEHPLVPCSPRPSSPCTRASGAGLIQTACVSPPPLEAPPSNFYPASLLFWPSSASLTWPGTLPLGSLQHAFASGPEGPGPELRCRPGHPLLGVLPAWLLGDTWAPHLVHTGSWGRLAH